MINHNEVDYLVLAAQVGEKEANQAFKSKEGSYSPSTKWEHCGPLLEKYKLEVIVIDGGYLVYHYDEELDMNLGEVRGEDLKVVICKAVIELTKGRD